jgi:hypothetical protein
MTTDWTRFIPVRVYASRNASTQLMTNGDIKRVKAAVLVTSHETTRG